MKNGKYVALDLFSGTGSATKYFRESDKWIVKGVDINPDLDRDEQMDILNLEPDMINADVDFVWASPPCKSFSVANLYNNWDKKNDRLRMPKSSKAVKGVKMVFHTLYLIESLNPDYWFMENPRGGLRSIIGQPQYEKRKQFEKENSKDEHKDKHYPGTVTYCKFGDDRMKPTDLWRQHPDNFEYRFCGNGMKCHDSAQRGTQNGTQGRNKGADRWKIPKGLAKHVFDTVSNEVEN